MNALSSDLSYGVDLSDPEVVALTRRLLLGSVGGAWARKCKAAGLDLDDVLQEILIAVLRRNNGANPYNPERAGLVTYLYVVTRSVVAVVLDRERRAKGRGWIVGPDDFALSHGEDQAGDDTPGWPFGPTPSVEETWEHAVSDMGRRLGWTPEELLEWLEEEET